LPAPALRFFHEPVQPLQSEFAPAFRRALNVAAQDVERSANADARAATRFAQVFRKPILLFGKTHAHQEQLCAACPDLLRDPRRFLWGKIPISRSGYLQARISSFQLLRCAIGNARSAAEQKDADAFLCSARAKVVDEFDSGHTIVQIGTASSRNGQQTDRIAKRKRARVHDLPVTLVALRMNDHFGSERNDLRARAFARKS
jgi:hypothetical protein